MFILILFIIISFGICFISLGVLTNIRNKRSKNCKMSKEEADDYANERYELELKKQFRNERKGIEGEAKVRASIDTMDNLGYQYRSIHNLKLNNGKYGIAQIDHVIVSETGVFVIETKNYSGSIYGKDRQSNWVQCLGTKRFTFKNPLHQNYGHIKAVERALGEVIGVEEIPIHSVVVFVGDCKLKVDTEEGNVITLPGLRSYLTRFNESSIDKSDVYNVYSRLLEADIAS